MGWPIVGACSLAFPYAAWAQASADVRAYHLPRGEAGTMLRQFANVSGKPVLFMMDKVQGEHTNAVQGEYSAEAALELMLVDTNLEVTKENGSGGFVVGRKKRAEASAKKSSESGAMPASKVKSPSRLSSWLWGKRKKGTTTRIEPDPVNGSNSSPSTDQPFVLSPFHVEAASDHGYQAASTLSGTRIRTPLRDIGSSISVVTEQFMRDTATTDARSLLPYTTNTETGGPSGNMSGAALAANYTDFELTRYRPQTITRVRGLAAADLARDLYLTDIPFDVYNSSRVDIQRGPNSVLFGLGSPAGIINNDLNLASFIDHSEVSSRFDDQGSVRASIELNRVLLPDELGLLIDSVYDDTHYHQRPAFERSERFYGALRYDPRFLKFGSAATRVRANFEHGRVDANRPRPNPLGDQISPWFDPQGLNKAVFDPVNAAADRARYPILTNIPRTAFNLVAIWPDPTSASLGGNGVPSMILVSRNSTLNTGLPQLAWSSVGSRGVSRAVSTAWGAKEYAAFYKDQQLLDPGVFDFYHQLIDGPNKREWQRFTAGSVALEESLFNGAAGIELGYDRQRFYSAADAAITGFRDGQAIAVDLNRTLLDGTPNPNLGRPYIASDSLDNASDYNRREAWRVTAFAQFDAEKHLGSNWLSKIVGRHLFTGLLNTQRVDKDFRKWRGYTTDAKYGAIINNLDQNSDSRLLVNLHYLGPSLLGAPSLHNAHLSPISARTEPASGLNTLFWNRNLNGGSGGWQVAPVGLLTRNEDKEQLYSPSSTKTRDQVTARALVWQAQVLDGLLVPTVGFRNDSADNYHAGPPPRNPATQAVDTHDPRWTLPATPRGSVSGNTTSWSLVVHSPAVINVHLPLEGTFDLFYNRSENFQAAAGRTDILGRDHPAPEGMTRDYGFLVTLFGGKFVLRANRYETALRNDSVAVVNPFFLGAVEALAWDATSRAANQAAHPQAVSAFLASLPSSEFREAWVFTRVPNGDNGLTTFNNRPGGMTQLADIVSKGFELELAYNILPNWRLALNAAKQEAVRSNLGHDLAAWIAERSPVWLGPAGDIDLDIASPLTLREYATQNLIIPYQSAQAQNGGPAQEVRKWRGNAVTHYDFRSGWLKGFSVGGAVRWQDRVAIGFPVITMNGVAQFDVKHPYYGPRETNVDLWIGYERKLTTGISWRIQLNARNVNIGDKLIPIYAQPDGTTGGARIAEHRLFQLTNTFTF